MTSAQQVAQQVVHQVISVATGSGPREQTGAPKKKPAAKKKMGPKAKPAGLKKPAGVRKPAKKPTKKIAVNRCRAKDVKTGKRCTREVKGKELCPKHKGHRMVYAQKTIRSA